MDENANTDEIEIDESGGDTTAVLDDLASKMQPRVEGSKFRLKRVEDPDIAEVYYSLTIPAGREERTIYLLAADDFNALARFDFENFNRLQSYEGIVSYSNDRVEVSLNSLNRGIPFDWRHIVTDRNPDDLRRPEPGKDFVTVSQNGKSISLGAPSVEFMALTNGHGRLGRVVLRLNGFQISNQTEADNALRTVGNAFLFQIDYAFSVTLQLARAVGQRIRLRKTATQRATELKFPNAVYDEAPLSLYFYGRSARGLPLLQFLAYYQAIEFFFPAYSRAEAQRKIRNILKDPGFRSDRDSDVGRILSVMSSKKSGGFGDERSQLRATLAECLIEEELAEFVYSNEERDSFLTDKANPLGVTVLPKKGTKMALLSEVASRIYEVRCQIVHTKSPADDDPVELLLPFSKEAGLLGWDIELIDFVARRVLISASSLTAMRG